MTIPTLEQEFKKEVTAHKCRILKTRLVEYHRALDGGMGNGVNIPYFMDYYSPECKADRDLIKLILLNDGLKEFDRLYELAYTELANRGELA